MIPIPIAFLYLFLLNNKVCMSAPSTKLCVKKDSLYPFLFHFFIAEEERLKID